MQKKITSPNIELSPSQWSKYVLSIVVSLFIFLSAGVWLITAFWPGPTLEANGRVIGHGCADTSCKYQQCPIDDCTIRYSIIEFTDAHGQTHQINRPEDNLTGIVTIHYRFITLFGNITLGVKVDPQGSVPIWNIAIAILGGVSFVAAILMILDYRSTSKKKLSIKKRHSSS